LRGLYSIGEYQDDPQRLRHVTAPALIVTGAETVAFHRAINAALLRVLPRAEPLELAAGHHSPVAAPEEFVAAWSRFQDRASSTPTGSSKR
jgi:pimeloyl-ACP methyl ester carboxylesterase